MNNNNNFLIEHRDKIFGGLIGLIFALLFIGFGFWKGLFIIVFVLAGIIIGGSVNIRMELQQLWQRLGKGRER